MKNRQRSICGTYVALSPCVIVVCGIILWLCGGSVSAQSPSIPQPQILDFPSKFAIPDKLQRLVIRFTVLPPEQFKSGAVGANPAVQVTGAAQTAGVRVEPLGSKGVCNLVFDKPIPRGLSTIILTYQAGGKTERKECVLNVVETSFSEQTTQAFSFIKPMFGKSFTLETVLSPTVQALKNSLFIAYSLGFDQKEEVPYTENFVSPLIPGIARKVALDVLWKHPQTGERVVLLNRIVDTEQTPPECTGTPIVEMLDVSRQSASKKSPVKPGTLEFLVKGIQLNYAVPVDVNERKQPPVPILAEINDVEITDMSADVTFKTNLQIFKGEEPDPKAPFVVSAKTVQANGTFDNGAFTITVKLRDLPKLTDTHLYSLRGVVALNIAANVLNRKASKAASVKASIPVSINIPLKR